jgi:hypothetical protein
MRFAGHPTAPITPSTGSRDSPESLVAIHQYAWSQSIGIAGRQCDQEKRRLAIDIGLIRFMLTGLAAELLEKSMKPFWKAIKSDKARAQPVARPLPHKVKKLLADAIYEPPKVISFPTDKMTKLTPVTMMTNM